MRDVRISRCVAAQVHYDVVRAGFRDRRGGPVSGWTPRSLVAPHQIEKTSGFFCARGEVRCPADAGLRPGKASGLMASGPLGPCNGGKAGSYWGTEDCRISERDRQGNGKRNQK
jgi:hypothetical protein